MSWIPTKKPTGRAGRGGKGSAPAPCTPVEELIEARRKEFDAMKKQLPTMQRKLKTLTAKASGMTARHQIHARLDAEEEAEALKQLITDVEHDTLRRQYDARVQPYIDALSKAQRDEQQQQQLHLQQQQQQPKSTPTAPRAPKKPATAKKQRARRKAPGVTRDVRVSSSSAPMATVTSIRDEFLARASGERGGPSAIFVVSGNSCEHCGEGTLRKQPTESTYVCDTCGHSSAYVESTSSTLGYNDEQCSDYASFSYKRVNHFQEWLNATQAKESTEVPPKVIEDVMSILYEQRLAADDISPEKVRAALKQLKQRRFYENTQLIYSLITGKTPPRFTSSQEELLRNMFLSIQAPFDKHCPPERKNFLSYSFVLFKFVELLGLDSFKSNFSLLKGKDKLFKQDVIWRGICADLNWEFIASV